MFCGGEHILSNMLFPQQRICNCSAAICCGTVEEEMDMEDTLKTEQDIDDMIFGFSDEGESER